MKSANPIRFPMTQTASLLLIGFSLGFSQTKAPPYRIHCGGEAFHDDAGNFWEADGHYAGGQTFFTDSAIAGTKFAALYQTERWNDATLGNLKYSFDVPEGEYNVHLHFAEIFDGDFSAGSRIFDVAINGSTVAQAVDIFAEVGADAALIKDYTVSALNGKIEVEFLNQTGNAKVSGIEIIGAAVPRATKAPYRIIAGGSNDFTDADGNLWESTATIPAGPPSGPTSRFPERPCPKSTRRNVGTIPISIPWSIPFPSRKEPTRCGCISRKYSSPCRVSAYST